MVVFAVTDDRAVPRSPGVCQNLENSKSCPADCVGPSYEYGAAILVAGYTEDFVYCSQEQNCESG